MQATTCTVLCSCNVYNTLQNTCHVLQRRARRTWIPLMLGPHFENSGAGRYLCILILSHFFMTFLCFEVDGLFVAPKIHICTRTTGLDGCLLVSMGYAHATCPCRMFHSSSLSPLNFRQVREKLAMQFLCSCNSSSLPLQNTCCHVLKRRTRQNKICIPSSAANHSILYPPSAMLVQDQSVSGSLVPVSILQHGF